MRKTQRCPFSNIEKDPPHIGRDTSSKLQRGDNGPCFYAGDERQSVALPISEL